MKNITKELVISALAIFFSAIFAIVGYFVLPDVLTVQITISGTGGTTMPKIIGLAIPLIICVSYSILYYKSEEKRLQNLIFILVGFAIYAFTFFVNL